MKIISVVGTRPNFIKLLPLAPKIAERFEHLVIHTGQHYDYEMNKTFFESLPLPKVDFHLNLDAGWSEIQKISEIMIQLERLYLKIKPQLILVYGDVNSTLAATIVASKLKIPSAHVEAGVRIGKGQQPEEVIRKLVDNCSDYLFCPTENAITNLKAEQVNAKYFLVGDVMYDAYLQNAFIAKDKQILQKLNIHPNNYQLVTIHRAENTDVELKLKSLIEILTSLKEITIFPCHPRTEKMLKQFNLWKKCQSTENLVVIPPLNYLNFLSLMIHARRIITDSGGVQREAYFAGVPCIILFDATPWPEIIQYGGGILAYKKSEIWAAIENFNGSGTGKGFGNGKASEKIVKIIEDLSL